MSNDKEFDKNEIQEWVEALKSVYEYNGSDKASKILEAVSRCASSLGIEQSNTINTSYCNSINVSKEIDMPGDREIEERLRSFIRWNAMAMVLRANKKDSSLGGHISSFASIATLYDVGFNHFFRGSENGFAGDLIFFQGHTSPGIYARSFMEGALSADNLNAFRTEAFDKNGLSSYPHPKLMPEYWQFPTVSMGLGPIQAVYQAHFMKYMHNRGLQNEDSRKVWCFIGDGETGEPETLASIRLASAEKLDNLIFVVNCNLQRLDGPVHGNGKIIQELEGVFRGAGWNTIKLIWGAGWDGLLDKDDEGILQKRMDEVCDGEYQNCKAKGGAYTRKEFFGKEEELSNMVAHLSDDEIYRLRRGGHDAKKVYNAYYQACNSKGKPTVILAKTVKGYGTEAGESKNIAHSLKKMDDETLLRFRDKFRIPLNDEQIKNLEYYLPAKDSKEIKYLKERKQALHGSIPSRKKVCDIESIAPENSKWKDKFDGEITRSISTTMVFVRILSSLVRDKKIGKRIVPIVPDEARTFGMESMFKQIGIYTSEGQKYIPQDADIVASYHESSKGQILQEGINEAGAYSAWLAAATSGYNYDTTMVPFYIYYSMFGFQRIGDLAWAGGDLQARGFLLGATAGRTTLAGEGLQHDDGHSLVYSSTIPNCISYDPAFSYELAAIISDGLDRMYVKKEGVFYYITLYNESYVHPAAPKDKKLDEKIIKGMYLFKKSNASKDKTIHILSSGSIFQEAMKASDILEEMGFGCNIWSVTSFTELAREGMEIQRKNALHASKKNEVCYVADCLKDGLPVVAVTDHVRQYVNQIEPFVENNFYSLGTDGYGRSDNRSNLRKFFEIDANHICYYSLYSLFKDGKIKAEVVEKAAKDFGIETERKFSLYL